MKNLSELVDEFCKLAEDPTAEDPEEPVPEPSAEPEQPMAESETGETSGELPKWLGKKETISIDGISRYDLELIIGALRHFDTFLRRLMLDEKISREEYDKQSAEIRDLRGRINYWRHSTRFSSPAGATIW